VGTTACRALESIPREAVGEQRGDTRLFIRPGFHFAWTDVLISNFHLPRSSLLMLVAALVGDRWKTAYRLAVEERYRFYSYGDANWIER
jgi:S-adenosylmethionine:tRNA ribosyltransferase-isomerase